MNQPNLFDFGGYKPRARQNDPVTSKQAAESFNLSADQYRSRMLLAIRARPKTANEAAAECVTVYGGSHESFRKRSGELKRAGLVYVAGHKRQDNGRNAEILAAR